MDTVVSATVHYYPTNDQYPHVSILTPIPSHPLAAVRLSQSFTVLVSNPSDLKDLGQLMLQAADHLTAAVVTSEQTAKESE